MKETNSFALRTPILVAQFLRMSVMCGKQGGGPLFEVILKISPLAQLGVAFQDC